MDLKRYKADLQATKEKVLVASQQKVNLKQVIQNGSYMYDYKFNKAKYLSDWIKRTTNELVKESENLYKTNKNKRLDDILAKIMVNTKLILENYLEPTIALATIEKIERDIIDLEKLMLIEKEIEDFEKEAAAPPIKRQDPLHSTIQNTNMSIILNNMPEEIHEAMQADADELHKTYNTGCYRSSIILCGRLLETALHRKYFDVTGNDALEKEPNIGLGKLIARMRDKGISLDPALPQQIHFINQVRIFSVHKKHEAFNPSQVQAQATILYTVDVLNRIFNK